MILGSLGVILQPSRKQLFPLPGRNHRVPEVRSGLPVILLGLIFVPAEICAQPTSKDSDASNASGVNWHTMTTENFTVYYGKGFACDAIQTTTCLKSAIASMTKEFSAYAPQEILMTIDCHVFLHPEPNAKASDGTSACIARSLPDGRRYAELHFLTPSRYSPDAKNSIGELKKDRNYFFRYIVHEYSSAWLGVIARSKEKGWYANGNDAPNWFWQGYEEYLGMTLSSEHNRKVTFAKYLASVKKDPDRVMIAHGYRNKSPRIVVTDDYIDGFALLAYMHDRHGKKAVQSILASDRETFGEAFEEAMQLNASDFYEKYQEWLQSHSSRLSLEPIE